ncbi:MAG: hypothetical protein ACK45Z_03890, partial [Dolichospermum sp.]
MAAGFYFDNFEPFMQYQWTSSTSSNSLGDNSLGSFLSDFQRQMLLKSLQKNCSQSQRQRIQIMLL